MDDITHIEDIVKTWAWNSFGKNREKGLAHLEFKDVNMAINWTKVHFDQSNTEFSNPKKVDLPGSKIAFMSTFKNNTDTEQDHSFSTERTTVNTATTSISKGYTRGFNLGLKLGLPKEVASATAGYRREKNINTTEETTEEQTITWTVNSNIKVPAKRNVTATMEIKEAEVDATFKLKVTVHGWVIVTLTNLRDNNKVIRTSEGDISQILSEAKGYKGYKVEGKTAIFDIEGKSKFRFGVRQEVNVDDEKIK